MLQQGYNSAFYRSIHQGLQCRVSEGADLDLKRRAPDRAPHELEILLLAFDRRSNRIRVWRQQKAFLYPWMDFDSA